MESLHDSPIAHWYHEPADRAVVPRPRESAPVLWRFPSARHHCKSARGLAHSKTWRGLGRFMEGVSGNCDLVSGARASREFSCAL